MSKIAYTFGSLAVVAGRQGLAWMLGWLDFLSLWGWDFSLFHSPSYAVSLAGVANFLPW